MSTGQPETPLPFAEWCLFLVVIVWNDLLHPLWFSSEISRTLTMALLMFRGEYESGHPMLFAGVADVTWPVAAYLVLQRWFIVGITTGTLKG